MNVKFFRSLTVRYTVTSITLSFGCFFFTKAQPVNQTGFENFADEYVFTKASWESEGFTTPWVNGFNQNRAHVDNAFSHSGSKSLRVDFPSGQYGPSNTGVQAPLKITPADQYYISYWLYFSSNFSWGTTSEGGKLPGLAGGANCSGCATCTGSNGFSARLMWRTGGKAVLYLYHMDKAGTCGDNLSLQLTKGTDFYFQKEQWYQVIERVKVNTGNNFDGEVELWINQQPALLVTGKRFVNNSDKVDNLYFSTFHGGSTAAWAPVNDCTIWFDDVLITTNPTDVFSVTAVEESVFQGQFNVYPNPLRPGENFILKTSSKTNDFKSIEWSDISGRVVHRINNSADADKVPQLPAGIYVLKIYLESEIVVRKVRVE